jgi:hypothetical protein
VRIRTDDEVYRVDAVWLGPPKATLPGRTRYVAWGVGTAVFLFALTVQRQLGIGFGFFSTGWALVATIGLTRLIVSRISHERPLGAVTTMLLREVTSPRERTSGRGGAVGVARIRINPTRPTRGGRRRAAAGRRAAKRLDRARRDVPKALPAKPVPDVGAYRPVGRRRAAPRALDMAPPTPPLDPRRPHPAANRYLTREDAGVTTTRRR